MGHAHIDKRCACCKVWLPVAQFYGEPPKRDAYCRPCRRSKDRERNKNRNVTVAAKKAADPNHFRAKKLISLYGITVSDFDAMALAQGGVCKICSKPETRTLYGSVAYLVVDHDHVTGKVRALLCHSCNTKLGAIENEQFHSSALSYLESFK